MRGELKPYCPNNPQWASKVILLLALTLSASGCNLIRSTLELPEKASSPYLLLIREMTHPILLNCNPSYSALQIMP